MVRLIVESLKLDIFQLRDMILVEKEGKRCRWTSAQTENYQLCFGGGHWESLAGEPAVYIRSVALWAL